MDVQPEKQAAMATSRTHLTALPPGFITVRIMQLIFTVVIIALSIFIIVVQSNVYQFIVLGSAVLTLIVLIWITVATHLTPKAYNYWAVLAMEIFFFLAWMDATFFAVSTVFYLSESYSYCNEIVYNVATQTEECATVYPQIRTYAENAAIACLAFVAALLLLWFVSMIVISVFIARHRNSGGRCKLGSPAPVPNRPIDPLLAQSEFQLRQQNMALQNQYLILQQQHLDLQRSGGFGSSAPMMQQYPQHGFARTTDLETGNAGVVVDEMAALGRGYEQRGYPLAYSPQKQVPLPVSPVSAAGSGSQQQQPQVPNMAHTRAGKERASEAVGGEEHVMSGAQ